MALKTFGVGKSDYYEFETQIFFDDAMSEDPKRKDVYVPNLWVKKMLAVINEAASAIYETEVELPPPDKIPTPYGGRLEWMLPGGNKIVVHVKNKNKIRHKKRWSQVWLPDVCLLLINCMHEISCPEYIFNKINLASVTGDVYVLPTGMEAIGK